MNVTQNNWTFRDDFNKTQTDAKTSALKQEKEWVNSLVEAQRTEDNFNSSLKKGNMLEMRQTLA